MKRTFLSLCLCVVTLCALATDRFNFNASWLLQWGDVADAELPGFKDKTWKQVTLPYAFNEHEAFEKNIAQLTDTVVWYRKHFVLPAGLQDKLVFIEFEGVRQAAEVYINGHKLGLHENGVMAFGYELTPYLNRKGDNVIALRIDNDWDYEERATKTKYQWNNRNFNANYGGIPKNVWLHAAGPVYQTLPLYNSLKTTGVYVAAVAFDIPGQTATIIAESEVMNATEDAQNVAYEVVMFDADDKQVATWQGNTVSIAAGKTGVCRAQKRIDNLHFWSWGYGYLYTVKTRLLIDGKCVDETVTRTGFRQTRFADGKIWLNGRVLQIKGFAQRTSNEWPAVGMSVPAWLSDYSNHLMVEDNANTVRWMHVTPWKQDVESCDRVGLIQAMPAGDAEKDSKDEQWRQRTELMRDAIIYNRNSPSVIFIECGNESISREHMIEMKSIRDQYDPHGGRAIGSREMLDISEAEYGGEMLYINKSEHHPLWAMEYCRDEGLRKYWDSYSYPYHKEGAGPLYRNADASDYNHNQDMLAVENIRRWYDYWRERPGTGTRVSSGGVKIIFSDTNTHFRGEENYRRSGVTDAMRIAKDAYFAHQAMWDGWVDTEVSHTYIIGHWNYSDTVTKPVYVVSTSDEVELYLNGRSLGKGERSNYFLFTFPDVKWESGELLAVSRNSLGVEESRDIKETVGEPVALRLHWIDAPLKFRADGADLRLGEIEVVDAKGRRCPLDNSMIHYTLGGPAEWLGGIAQGPDNYILSSSFPVECGVNRFFIRSTNKPGSITIKAEAEGLNPAVMNITSVSVKTKDGFYTDSKGNPATANWGSELPVRLERGTTPLTPSYTQTMEGVKIFSAETGINQKDANNAFDDNELSEWKNDGTLSTAWMTYHLERRDTISDICLKLTGWRLRSYPLEVYCGNDLVWKGDTPKSLGYVHIPLNNVVGETFTVCLSGQVEEKDAFGQVVELAAPVGNELDLFKSRDGAKTKKELRIIEIEFLKRVK